MSIKGSQKYEISKELLEKLYIVEGLSGRQIWEKLKIGDERTIKNYIKKYGLSRNRSQAAMITHNGLTEQPIITNSQKEIIIGELLGDGSLKHDCKNSIPFYRHSSKYREYCEWLGTVLPSLRWAEVTETKHSQTKKDGSPQISYNLRSQCHPDLLPLYDMFYDQEGRKHIPTDLKLTSTVLLHWFLGDGTAGMFSAGKSRLGIPKQCWQMTIYACAYTREELESTVMPQLAEMGIVATVTMKPGRHRIRISSGSHERFYRLIGQCPCSIYGYKWRK